MPAITQENGNVACVATSKKINVDSDGSPCKTETFSNINSYVSNYWGNRDQARTYATTVTRLVLDAPFVYQPDWGTTSDYHYPPPVVTVPGLKGLGHPEPPWIGGLRDHGKGYSDYGYEDYGYIPQTLVDFLSSSSDISSPLLQSNLLFPGGPEIDKFAEGCREFNAFVGDPQDANDLAEPSAEKFNNIGCLQPGACIPSPVIITPTPSATAQAGAKISPLAAKTPAAINQGSKHASVGNGESSNVENENALPQVLRQQSSPTGQSNGGSLGQLSPSQPFADPVAPAQDFNGVTLGQEPPPQPGSQPAPPSSRGAQGSNPSLQPRPRPVAVTTKYIASQLPKNIPTALQDLSQHEPSIVPAGGKSIAEVPVSAVAPVIASTLIADSANDFVIDSQTLAASALMVTGVTPPLSPVQTPRPLEDIIAQGFNELKKEQGRTLARSPELLITIENQSITINDASEILVHGQTLAVGATPIVIGGNTFSVAPAAPTLVVNGITSTLSVLDKVLSAPAPVITVENQLISADSASRFIVQGQTPAGTSTLPAPLRVASTPAPVITIGGQTVTEDSASEFVALRQTLNAGGTPVVLGGTTFSLAPFNSALVVNGVTSKLAAPEMSLFPISHLTINGQVITADSQGQFLVGNQVLRPGGSPIIVSGSTYSLATFNTAVVINGITSALASPERVATPAPVLTIAGRIITAISQSKYVIDGQTLSPGGSPITVSGNTYSLVTFDSAIVVNGMTTPLPAVGFGVLTAANPVSAISELLIAGKTAIAGGAPVTISGVPISLLPSGREVIVGGITEAVPGGPTPVLTVGSQAITVTKGNEYVVEGQTLTSGAAATISGVRVTLAPNGTNVVLQGSTIDLSPTAITSQTEPAAFRDNGRSVQPGGKVEMGSFFLGCLIIILII